MRGVGGGKPVNVVITGAGSGIGRALVLLYAEQCRGSRFVLAGRDQTKLDAVKSEVLACGTACRVQTFAADLSNEQANTALRRKAAEALSGHPIHYLILNAGSGHFGNFSDIPDPLSVSARLMADNYWTVVYGVRAFHSLLRQEPASTARTRTRLVVTSAVQAIRCDGGGGKALFAASKSGVEGFIESLRREECYPISSVYPCAVHTPFYERQGASVPEHAIGPEEAAVAYARGLDRCRERIYLDRCTRMAHYYSGWMDTLAQVLFAHAEAPSAETERLMNLAHRYQCAGICASSVDMQKQLLQEMCRDPDDR